MLKNNAKYLTKTFAFSDIWKKFCGKNFHEFKIREMIAAQKKKKKQVLLQLTTIKVKINHYFWKFPRFYNSFWFYEFWKNFRVLHFKKYPWFRVEKLSRFDDLEFPKAETFAKMTEKRESWCPWKFLPLRYSKFKNKKKI